MNLELYVTSLYWKKDSNSLFDFDASDVISSNLVIGESSKIYHEENQIKMNNNNLKCVSSNYLANIEIDKEEFKIKIDDKFYIKPNKYDNSLLSDNWMAIRHTFFENQIGFKLYKGSIIKLGKIVFKVKEVLVSREDDSNCILKENKFKIERNITNNENLNQNFNSVHNIFNENLGDISNLDNSNLISNANYINDLSNNENNEMRNFSRTISNNQNHMNDNTNINNLTNLNNLTNTTIVPVNIYSKNENFSKLILKPKFTKQTQNNICKFCLCDGSEDNLINICKCTGSVKYIHLNCLRRWLISKVSIKSFNYLTIYSYKNLECELCKTAIPDLIKIKDKIINLINPNSICEENDKKLNSFIALECIKEKSTSDKDEKKIIYVINMKNKSSLRIGRSNDSDVRMTDISISRFHAILKIENGSMFIQDDSSKFGTHVNVDINKEITLIPFKKLAIKCGKYFLTFIIKKSCISYLLCRKIKELKNNYEDYNQIFYKNIYSEKENKEEIKIALLEILEEELENKFKNYKKLNTNFSSNTGNNLANFIEDNNQINENCINSLENININENNISVISSINNNFKKIKFLNNEIRNQIPNSTRLHSYNTFKNKIKKNHYINKPTFNETEKTKSKIISHRINNDDSENNFNFDSNNLILKENEFRNEIEINDKEM